MIDQMGEFCYKLCGFVCEEERRERGGWLLGRPAAEL